MGGKLKEMGKKATRSEVGRKAMREGNVVDLGEDVRFKGGMKARRYVTEPHLNKKTSIKPYRRDSPCL